MVVLRLAVAPYGIRAVWTVQASAGQTTSWMVPRWTKPCLLGRSDRVLGLADPASGAVMPLDAGLRWIDLSAGERSAVAAARQQGGWGRVPRS